MAEMALGGIEVTIKSRTRPRECAHDTTLAVLAAGVERSICETCGHVSVRFVARMTGPVTRNHFARPADEDLANEAIVEGWSPFADDEHIGLRRRGPTTSDSLLLTA